MEYGYYSLLTIFSILHLQLRVYTSKAVTELSISRPIFFNIIIF